VWWPVQALCLMERLADWMELEQRPVVHPLLREQLLVLGWLEAEVPVDLRAQGWLLQRRQASEEQPVSEALVSQV
jgi:hypothetical protein